jgi:hypothetical protein
MPDTVTLEIHPAIGIARVGSSQEFLLGPEPGMTIDPNRRDNSPARLLKRQAARFRVFFCTRNALGTITAFEELTPDKATITWTAHLVNRKAAAPSFLNGGVINTDPKFRRNGATGNDASPIDKSLIIDGGSQTLAGASQPKSSFQGNFQGHPVLLGEMSTDADGRLIIVGGFGKSETFKANNPIKDQFADNDNWHDDTSDGPVSASVHFLDGRPDQTVDKPAWVICCQPDFAPGIGNLVTLYDAMIDQATRRGVLAVPTFKPAFDRDILPLLKRALAYQWVNRFNRAAHGPGGPGDFLANPDLGDPTVGPQDRVDIFSLLRNPDAGPTPPPAHAMPALLADDYFDDPAADPSQRRVQPLTRGQYRILREWSNSNFDATGPASPLELLPDLLTRTVLEACVGASFCPGIEAGRKTRDATIFMAGEAFRFDHSKLQPGGLTESMALPWQADFSLCRWEGRSVSDAKGRGWWPAQRPDHVLRKPDDIASAMVDWDRAARDPDQMVANWDQLGVVLETQNAAGSRVFVETQRTLAEETNVV